MDSLIPFLVESVVFYNLQNPIVCVGGKILHDLRYEKILLIKKKLFDRQNPNFGFILSFKKLYCFFVILVK